jgi:hypothetical protein
MTYLLYRKRFALTWINTRKFGKRFSICLTLHLVPSMAVFLPIVRLSSRHDSSKHSAHIPPPSSYFFYFQIINRRASKYLQIANRHNKTWDNFTENIKLQRGSERSIWYVVFVLWALLHLVFFSILCRPEICQPLGRSWEFVLVLSSCSSKAHKDSMKEIFGPFTAAAVVPAVADVL